MGKTLLVYYALNEKTRASFEASRRAGKVDVLELRERYDRSVLDAATLGLFQALSGTASHIDEVKVDLSAYETVLVATPVWGGCPAPAVNAFLHQADLKGREVCAMLITGVGSCAGCGDILRRRIQSAGGVCRDLITVNKRDLYVEHCDAYELSMSKAQLA